MSKVILFFFVGSGLLTALFISAKEIIVINEIAWMGTNEQWQNEWIELYNPNDFPVSLEDWVLKAKDDSPCIALSGTIGANSYFLLERTDDTTVPDIGADQIYKGGLNNAGEHLTLLNSAGETVDEADCTLGWFAGSNDVKKTMERIDPLSGGSDPSNWKNSQKAGGTPRIKNSPKEKPKQEKEIKTVYSASDGSNFFFILIIAIAISLFFSMLTLAFWLKIRQKRGKIRHIKDNSIY